MNYFHIATLLLIAAKIMEKIDWSWWLVLAPSIFSLVVGLVIIICALVFVVKENK
jgi:hypothetical protein